MECACGVFNSDTAKFCKACGSSINNANKESSELTIKCHACDATLKRGSLFCSKCGAKSAKLASVIVKSLESEISAGIEEASCSKCNTLLKVNAKFCPSCGQSTGIAETTQTFKQPSIRTDSKSNSSKQANLSPEPIFENGNNSIFKNKKKLTLIGIASICIAGVAGLSWYGFNDFYKSPTLPIITSPVKAAAVIPSNVLTPPVTEVAQFD